MWVLKDWTVLTASGTSTNTASGSSTSITSSNSSNSVVTVVITVARVLVFVLVAVLRELIVVIVTAALELVVVLLLYQHEPVDWSHLGVGLQVRDQVLHRLQPDLLVRFTQVPKQV